MRMKKEERKKQIKDVAIKLMTKKGYRNTSVQDILDEINSSKSVFYNCYTSKEELFREILDDSAEDRYRKILQYKQGPKLERKEWMIEALLDKILDYNDYKKLSSTIVTEMIYDEELYNLHKEVSSEFTKEFIEFCKNEGFEEYIKISNVEFGLFISSLIIGVEVFRMYDNQKYRDMLRDIISAYFDKINLFNE